MRSAHIRWLVMGTAFLLFVSGAGCGDDSDGSSGGGGSGATGGGGSGGTGGATGGTGGQTGGSGGSTGGSGGSTGGTGGSTGGTGGATGGTGGSTGGTGGSGGTGGTGGTGGGNVGCDALPSPTGNIIDVTPADTGDLTGIVGSAATGDTIRFASGTYDLNGVYLWISTPGITLRSASGNRDDVVLDGNDQTTEIITIAASDVTIADITLRRAHTHPIHVVTNNADTVNTLIYNVHIVDPREQAIKVNPNQDGTYVDYGEVACSHIELTDAGRPNVQPDPGGCYTGGFDGHQARGWVIRDNVIEGFWCNSPQSGELFSSSRESI